MLRLGWTTAFIMLFCALEISGDIANNSKVTGESSTTKYHISTIETTNSSYYSSENPKSASNVRLNTDYRSDNITTFLRLEDVLRVFDLSELAGKWPNINGELNEQCSNDMSEYFHGLRQHNLWATKSKYFFFF